MSVKPRILDLEELDEYVLSLVLGYDIFYVGFPLDEEDDCLFIYQHYPLDFTYCEWADFYTVKKPQADYLIAKALDIFLLHGRGL